MRLNAAEALKTNNQVTEALENAEKNAEIAEAVKNTQKEVKNLKEKVETQEKPRPVEQLSNGNIRIPYNRNGEKWNFDINPKSNTVIVRKRKHIKALGEKRRSEEERIPVDISSQQALEQSMNTIIDKHIGNKRAPIPQKLEKARNFVQKNPEAYTEKDFERNEETQTLSYTYLLGKKGAGINLQKIDQSIVITIGVHNDFGPGSNKVQKIVPISQVDTIPNAIHTHFTEGVDLTTYFDIMIDDDYTPNDNLLKKIKQKAQTATNIFKKNIEQ